MHGEIESTTMEVCIDSVASAHEAHAGDVVKNQPVELQSRQRLLVVVAFDHPQLIVGAIRVELCGNLMEGGTTPTLDVVKKGKEKNQPVELQSQQRLLVFSIITVLHSGMLKIIKQCCSIPVYVMIRPRGGDFLYNEEEFQVMKEDILALCQAGADGFVFGCLTSDGSVDEVKCRELIHLVKPLPVTFHRAIDVSRDILESLETVITLGFDRVLTSGGKSSALEGLPMIKQMVTKAKGRTLIMPGGGINEDNLDRILYGCGAKEFHCSARSTVDSNMAFRKSGVPMGASLCPPEFSIKVTDRAKVKRLMQIKKEIMQDFTAE